eukprot:5402036-Alexandrium_andersonii.AAC.1
MVMARRHAWAKPGSLELSRGPLCTVVRAEREYGNGILPRAPDGFFRVVARAGRRGGIDQSAAVVGKTE